MPDYAVTNVAWYLPTKQHPVLILMESRCLPLLDRKLPGDRAYVIFVFLILSMYIVKTQIFVESMNDLIH